MFVFHNLPDLDDRSKPLFQVVVGFDKSHTIEFSFLLVPFIPKSFCKHLLELSWSQIKKFTSFMSRIFPVVFFQVGNKLFNIKIKMLILSTYCFVNLLHYLPINNLLLSFRTIT